MDISDSIIVLQPYENRYTNITGSDFLKHQFSLTATVPMLPSHFVFLTRLEKHL